MNWIEKILCKIPFYKARIDYINSLKKDLEYSIEDYQAALQSFLRLELAPKELTIEKNMEQVFEDMYSKFLQSNEARSYIRLISEKSMNPYLAIQDPYGLKDQFLRNIKIDFELAQKTKLSKPYYTDVEVPVDEVSLVADVPSFRVNLNINRRY